MNAIFITVRTGSTRLPDKCIRKVAGEYAIQLLIDRVKKSKKAQRIVLCTTRRAEDDTLCKFAKLNKIKFYRGSVKDKLVRWQKATKQFGVSFFVTADGDDLLCDPELIDLAFTQHERTGADFVEARNVPTGAFTYGIKTSALNKVCKIKGTDDTEMMVPYFTETGLFKVEQLQDVPKVLQRPELRMTMDYPEDLMFFDNIFRHFNGRSFTLQEAIEYLDDNPDVVKLNQKCQEFYLANQKKLTGVVLK